jgi:FKBP-type peptidyl-prolyl cis-trans isomerase FkpA
VSWSARDENDNGVDPWYHSDKAVRIGVIAFSGVISVAAALCGILLKVVVHFTPRARHLRTTIYALLFTSAVTAAACGGGTPPQTPAASTTAPAGEQTTAATAAPTPAIQSSPAPPAQPAPTSAGARPPLQPPKRPARVAPRIPAQPAFTRTDLTIGTGAVATAGKSLSVHYTGWLYDPSAPGQKGLQFDSSIGGSPFNFTLGAGGVIRGWDQGFEGMRVGGKRRLIIPPDLGYGEAGAGGGVIPPNATLIFEMELVDVGN